MNLESLDIPTLKEELTVRGIEFHPNLGKAKLIALLQTALANTPPVRVTATKPQKVFEPKGTPVTERQLLNESRGLHSKVTIVPLDPNEGKDSNVLGRIGVGNEVTGTDEILFPFNTPCVLPDMVIEALKTQTLPEVINIGDSGLEDFWRNGKKTTTKLESFYKDRAFRPKYRIIEHS